MASAAQRIVFEIDANASELQAAVNKAAASLKDLGTVVKRQAEQAAASGGEIIKSNARVAASYQETAAKIKAAGNGAAASIDKQVAATRRAAEQQVAAAREVSSSTSKMAASYDRAATAATVSADRQVAEARKVTVALDGESIAAIRASRTIEQQEKKKALAFGSSSSQMTKAGKAITLGLVGVAAASIDMAAHFQANTLRLQTQAQATTRQVALLREGLLKMAGEVGYTPNQLADGMYHVVSALNAVIPPAQRVSAELHIMKIAAEGAQIGHADLEQTTYTLVSALNALHEPAKDAGKVMGQLNAIVGSGDMTMTDLEEALKSGLIPAARTFHVSFQSVGAALAVMGDMGMRGALAGTRLRMSLALLAAPSEKAAKYLEAIGMSSKEATARTHAMRVALDKAGLRMTTITRDLHQPNGLAYALQDLNRHLIKSGLTADAAGILISHAFGGGRSGAAIQLMAQNTDRLNAKFKQIGEGGKTFGKSWAATEATFSTQVKKMVAGAEALGIKIGTVLIPIATKAIHGLMDMATWLGHNHAALYALAGVAGLLATSYLWSKLKDGAGLIKEMASDAKLLATRLAGLVIPGSPGVPGAKTPAGGTAGALQNSLQRISGARGFDAPGSLMNPIVVAIEGGEYAGLGGRGAAIGQRGTTAGAATEAKNAATSDAVTAEELAAVEGTQTTGLVAGISSKLGPMLAGLARVMAPIAAIGGLVGALTTKGNVADRVGGAVSGATMGLVPAKPVTQAINFGVGQLQHGGIGGAVVGAGALTAATAGVAAPLTVPLGALLGGLGIIGGPSKTQEALSKLSGDVKKVGDLSHASASQVAKLGEEANKLARMPDMTAKQRAGLQQLQHAIDPRIIQNMVGEIAGIRFPSEPQFIKDMQTHFKSLSVTGRQQGADAMIELAASMERNGQLPKGATDRLIHDIEGKYPALKQFIVATGHGSMQDLATEFKSQHVIQTVQDEVNTINRDWGTLPNLAKTNGDNVYKNWKAALNAVKEEMHTGTAASREAARQEYQKLLSMQDQVTATVESHWRNKLNSMLGDTHTDFVGMATTAYNELKSIGLNTNQALKALGISNVNFGFTPPQAVLTPGANGQLRPNATGGYIGMPGEKGRDEVPIIVGRGEAVLNHSQQRVVNQALVSQGIGGLPEVFSRVTRPHYMARGGYAGGGIVTASEFGGPGDPGTGSTGYRGDNLYAHPDSYAELNMGTALGGLPYLAPLLVSYHGRTARLFKRDIGAGGGGIGGHPRAIDLWFQAAQALGFSGLDLVQINGPAGVNVSIGGGGGASQIVAPHVTGPKGPLTQIIQKSADKMAEAANKYIAAHTPAVDTGVAPGTVMAMGGAPAQVQAAMMAAANQIMGLPYIWGGGHGSFSAGGYDCSGAVSYLLHAAGLLSAPLTTDGLKTLGDPGPGKYITWGVRGSTGSSAHTMLSFFGKFLEAGGGGPLGQPRVHWDSGWDGAFDIYRHPRGYAAGGTVGDFGEVDPAILIAHAPNLATRPDFQAYAARRGRRVTPKPDPGLRGAPTRLPAAKGAKPKTKKPTHKKPGKGLKLPTLKQLPGFDSSVLDKIAAIDLRVQKLGNWQSYIEQLHSSVPVEALVTLADGSEVVNLNGMVDPSSGQWVKGISQRLAEIGNPGPPATRDINTELGIQETLLDAYLQEQTLAAAAEKEFGPWLTAAQSAYGVDKKRVAWIKEVLTGTGPLEPVAHIFDSLGDHIIGSGPGLSNEGKQDGGGADAKQVLDSMRRWVQRAPWSQEIIAKAKEYRNKLAQIEWLKKRREELPLEQADRDYAISRRFAFARNAIQNTAAKGTFDASSALSQQLGWLDAEQRAAEGNLPKPPPKGWKGDRRGWDEQHRSEVASIVGEFDARKRALRESAAAHAFEGRLSKTNALFRVGLVEAAEKHELAHQMGVRKNLIADELRGDQSLVSRDKTFLSGLSSQFSKAVTTEGSALSSAMDPNSGFGVKLEDYVDPIGSLSINILTEKNITIPGLLREIGQLKGTTAPASSSAGSGGTDTSSSSTADNSALLQLLQQQLQATAQQLALSEADFSVLSGFAGQFAAGTLPKFLHGGPVLNTGLALVHRGEWVSPDPTGPYGNQLVADRHPAPSHVELHLHGESGELVKLIDARIDGRSAPVVSRELGRRQRAIVSAPGRVSRF